VTQGLTQAQLDELIGDPDTLLPDRPSDNGTPLYVWSCWETPPAGFDALVQRVSDGEFRDPQEVRAEFLCGREPRHRTGTPLSVEAPRPPDHPLGDD
jgi:hypothetical protein